MWARREDTSDACMQARYLELAKGVYINKKMRKIFILSENFVIPSTWMAATFILSLRSIQFPAQYIGQSQHKSENNGNKDPDLIQI